MRRSFGRTPAAVAVLLAMAAAMISGNAAASAAPAAAVKAKGTLALAFETDVYGWDPSNQPGYQNWAAEAVWDQLVFQGAGGQLEAGAAKSWKITDQNKTFTAKLRPGMKFTDGTPVNAKAVIANFKYSQTHGGGQADYKGISMVSTDPLTFSVSWPDPQANINQKVAMRLASPKSLASGKFDVPVGSGPYVLNKAKTTTGSVYTFDKNPKHWNAAKYPFQKLVVKVFASGAASLAAIRTGQVDAGLVGQSDVATVEAAGLKVKSFQGQTTRLLLTDHLGKSIPALGNLKVRQAINMVFDKAAMAKALYLGKAEPTAQVFRKGTDAYIPGLKDPYPYNVAKAKQLMAEAGFADGFSIELPTLPGQNFETLLPYVQQQLALINIKATEAPLSGANAIGDLLSGKYPVVLWQLGNLGNSLQQIYIESTPAGWWNLMHQPDTYVDSRYEQLATASPALSKKLQQEINRYIIDQAWFAPMVYMGTNFAYNPKKVSIPTSSDNEALTPKLRDFK